MRGSLGKVPLCWRVYCNIMADIPLAEAIEAVIMAFNLLSASRNML